MKIKYINEDSIQFDNGTALTFDHDQDCCENNYADFKQIEKSALDVEFGKWLLFEGVEEKGFRFGGVGTPMFFIPCYSCQNGYYSTDIQILFDGEVVVSTECEEVLD